MHFEIDLDGCVVCLSQVERNIEHLLPQALGGRLNARLLCTDCNSRFGQTLVGDLVRDPSIVVAVSNLQDVLPALYASIMSGVGYVAPGPDGLPIHIRNGRLRARSTEQGAILMETGMATGHLEGMLQANGVSSEEIESALDRFSALADGEDLDMGGGIVVRKTSIEKVSPYLSSSLVDERWPALAALEYLAFTVGSLVLDEACNPIRSYVQGGDLPDSVVVERLLDSIYEPAHGMYWSRSEESLDFYVRLFRAVVFRVRLKEIRIRSESLPTYIEQLDTGKSLLSTEGLQGPFTILNT